MTPAEFMPVVGTPNIRFHLACIDPDGNPTTGILRYEVPNTSFTIYQSSSGLVDEAATGIKLKGYGGANGWPSNTYLNIWVCNLNGNILGYSSVVSSLGVASNTDGVVIKTTCFGNIGNVNAPYDLGRTATHEIGHWLNLIHIWGNSACGNDMCNDTPTQAAANYGCPTFPSVSASCANAPNGDMFMNYMDYTDDNCMNTFTNEQVIRMRSTFLGGGPRAYMLDNFFKFQNQPTLVSTCTPVTIKLFNPTCEEVVWQVSGPATTKSSDNKSITLNITGNGTITITATSGSYIATHTFNVVSQALILGTYGISGNNTPINTINSVQPNQVYTVNVSCQGATTFVWTLISGNPSFATNNNGTQLDFNLGGSSSATFKVTTIGTCGVSSRTITFITGGHWVANVFPNPTDTDAKLKIYKADMNIDDPRDYPAF